MYLFVSQWGIMGAVPAHIVSRCIYAGIVYLFTQRLFHVRYSFGKIAMLLLITILCYGLSLLCGSGIALSSLSIEEFTALSKWDKLANAWHRIQWLSIIAKMGILGLWGILIWFSGILPQEDKALAIRVFKRGLQKLRLYRV
jgi:hypothetical protein